MSHHRERYVMLQRDLCKLSVYVQFHAFMLQPYLLPPMHDVVVHDGNVIRSEQDFEGKFTRRKPPEHRHLSDVGSIPGAVQRWRPDDLSVNVQP